MHLRIDGVFNFDTFQFLRNQKITHFGLDHFPQSLNFIQGHEAAKILAQLKSDMVFFGMENEREPIIESLVSEWNKQFPFLHEQGVIERVFEPNAPNLNLKNPISMKLMNFEHKDSLLKIPNLKYVVVTQGSLVAQKLGVEDLSLIKMWFTEHLPQVKFILNLNWDEPLDSKVRSLFGITTFNFHLGSGLMSGYRTLDYSITQKVLDEVYKRLRQV